MRFFVKKNSRPKAGVESSINACPATPAHLIHAMRTRTTIEDQVRMACKYQTHVLVDVTTRGVVLRSYSLPADVATMTSEIDRIANSVQFRWWFGDNNDER